MTAFRRTLGLALVAFTLAQPVRAAALDEIQDTFNEAVELLRQGKDAEALAAFQRVLALDPSHAAAYDLWQATEHDVWLDIMVKGGDFELVAKRLSQLAKAGRAERRDDEAAIRALVETTLSEDVLERRRAVLALSAEHGEFAVPYLLPFLADAGNEDRRVLAMQALTRMSAVVVPPLLAALSTEDAFQRRNVALVLGYVGDPRAAGLLTWHAETDADGAVRAAASEAAAKCGAQGDGLSMLLENGENAHLRRGGTFGELETSSVVWSWSDGALQKRAVPAFLYGDELALQSFVRALRASPASLEARAGIALARVSAKARLDAYERAGVDVSEWQAGVDGGLIAVAASGLDAVDLALRWAVTNNDSISGAALCRVLGDHAQRATPALAGALRASDGALRAEAASATGEIAVRTGATVPPEVVTALGDAAARELSRIAFLIDPDPSRAARLVAALNEQGMFVTHFERGIEGLTVLRRSPGVDVVLVADSLPDLTAAQVVSELRADERLGQVPLFIVAADADVASEVWGDAVTGAVTDADGVAEVLSALEGGLEGERARAAAFAERAASTLARLAAAGRTDLTPALTPLSRAAGREDEVAVPAMQALGAAGGPTQVADLVDVLVDEARSDEARIAAGQAVAAILGRNPLQVGPDGAALIQGVVASEASLPVRHAAALALGQSRLDAETRAAILIELDGAAASE